VIREQAVEPGAFGVNQRRGWASRPSARPKRIAGRGGQLKDRTGPPDPYVGTARRYEKRSLQVVQPELLVRAWLVGRR